MKVHKLLSSGNTDIFHPNNHLEGCTEVSTASKVFVFWQGTPEEEPYGLCSPFASPMGRLPCYLPPKAFTAASLAPLRTGVYRLRCCSTRSAPITQSTCDCSPLGSSRGIYGFPPSLS